MFRYERDCHGRGHHCLRVEPLRKAEQRLRDRIGEQTGPQWNWMPLPMMIGRLNQTLRGWMAYFSHGHPHRVAYRLDGYVLMRLYRHLCRRSQRRYKIRTDESLVAHLQRLGLQILRSYRSTANAFG